MITIVFLILMVYCMVVSMCGVLLSVSVGSKTSSSRYGSMNISEYVDCLEQFNEDLDQCSMSEGRTSNRDRIQVCTKPVPARYECLHCTPLSKQSQFSGDLRHSSLVNIKWLVRMLKAYDQITFNSANFVLVPPIPRLEVPMQRLPRSPSAYCPHVVTPDNDELALGPSGPFAGVDGMTIRVLLLCVALVDA